MDDESVCATSTAPCPGDPTGDQPAGHRGGHPGGYAFRQFAKASGYACMGAGTAYIPYLLSNYHYLAWRYGIPEVVYEH